MSKLLQHHLTNSPIEPDENGIPLASPSSALRFSSFVSLYPPTDRSYESFLFRLGHALFDEIDLRLDDSITIDIRYRATSLRRKAAVSAWLEDAVAPSVEADLRRISPSDSASTSFLFLTGNQVEKACDAAIEGRNLKLATLIAQASGGDLAFQSDLRDTLAIWREERVDAHINVHIRKVYALLAGIVDTLEASSGTGLERSPDVVIHKDLDWKRLYGLHLWFSEPGEAPLAAVFQAYNVLWKTTTSASPPTPPHPPSIWNPPSTEPPPLDALFSLIRLHADPACSLSHILNPLSFTASPMDYCLPWHLYIHLSRCLHVCDFADRGYPKGSTNRDVDMESGSYGG